MGLNLGEALRLFGRTNGGGRGPAGQSVAFVGSGGKTTAILELAQESPCPVWIAATTHLGDWQPARADSHFVIEPDATPTMMEGGRVAVFTGPLQADRRYAPLDPHTLHHLRDSAAGAGRLLLIEADGSRQKPLKAPAAHEPPIPPFVELVVVVAGVTGVGRPLTEAFVHRPGVFGALSGLQPAEAVTAESLARVLLSAAGAQKNIPAAAARRLLLNQADTVELQAVAGRLAELTLAGYDGVAVASLAVPTIHAVQERVAGIVLAAGAATRFGSPKQLLDWHGRPFVRAVSEEALRAGLSPVVVVTGSFAEDVEAAVDGLPLEVARNPDWQEGQASSIRAGMKIIGPRAGAAVFLLADQPQVGSNVIEALVAAHSVDLPAIVAPLILEERRGNPVLFDRTTFSDLAGLRGDTGGRHLFSKYPVRYMPWHDARLLIDIDTQEQYRQLLSEEPG